MRLAAYQQCRTLDGWVPVEVGSRSEPGKTYVVLVNPWGERTENVCECDGYRYRGECAHQHIADQKLCKWSGIGVRVARQTDQQQRTMTCPMCGGPTMWAFKPYEEGDVVVEEG